MKEFEGLVEAAGTGAWQEVSTPHWRRLRVRFVIPGERVRVGRRDHDPGHADLLEVLEASPHRREPHCPHFGPCGGCQLQHVEVSFQLELRAERTRAALVAAGFPEAADSLRLVEAPAAFGYRSRARFQAAGGPGGPWQLGFHETGGSRTLDVSRCPILTPELQAAWQDLRQALVELEPTGLTGLEVTALPGSGSVLVTLNPRDRAPEPWPALGQQLIARGVATGVSAQLRRDDERPSLVGEPATLGRTPAGRPVATALGGFVQGNLGGADQLCDELVRLSEPAGLRVLELHAGAGLLSHALAEAGAEVRAFELDGASVEAARLLPPPSAGSLELREGDADRAFEAHAADSDLLVTDPSRSGLGDLAQVIAKSGPERLAGVWCSLDALERDLTVLRSSYRLSAVSLVDLFPQTRHCEVVALLER